jgi:hypothetical protein
MLPIFTDAREAERGYGLAKIRMYPDDRLIKAGEVMGKIS